MFSSIYKGAQIPDQPQTPAPCLNPLFSSISRLQTASPGLPTPGGLGTHLDNFLARNLLTLHSSLTLSYKGLPYKTQWVEYPDIQAVSIQYGAAPTDKRADGSPRYTVPMIYDPNTKTAIADSAKIAMYLDKAYPSTPTVFPPGSAALQMAFAESLWDLIGSDLFRNLAPDHFANLSPSSLKTITPIIETIYGKKVDELGGEEHWVAVEKALGKVLGYIEANGEGTDGLLMGDEACFADFALVSIFVWARIVLGENSAGWKRIAGWHGGRWARLYARFEKYLVYEA